MIDDMSIHLNVEIRRSPSSYRTHLFFILRMKTQMKTSPFDSHLCVAVHLWHYCLGGLYLLFDVLCARGFPFITNGLHCFDDVSLHIIFL